MRRSVVPDRIAALSIAILLALVALTTSGVIATMASGTETRSLTSTADTQIVENAPTKNYGAVSSLGVNENDQSSIGKDKFALVKWDLSEIAPGTQISSASVTLNVTNTSTETYQAYVLKKPWAESAATWDVYSSGKPWEVAGAKGSLDKEATAAGSITPSVKGKNTLTLPLTVVQGWVDDPSTNQGIIIAYLSSTRGFNFNSREDTDPTRRPQLTLDLIPDTTPPETTIDSGPSGTISSGDANFTFSSSAAGSTYECRMDGEPFSACVSPKSYTALAAGDHTFSVRAKDAAGNADATPASHSFTVAPPDTTPPETTIDIGPLEGSTSALQDVSFTFTSSEVGSTLECSLDSAAYTVCTSPKTYINLSEGSHTFSVKAADAAGNIDASPASTTWTVDTTAPETTIDSGPSGTTTVAEATFAFSSEDGATYECRLDGAAYSACTSPKSYTNLYDGSHTFDVRATDGAGNVDAPPASSTFTVEVPPPPQNTTPQDTTIDSGPSGTVSNSKASFAFSSSEEAGSTFECSLDGSAFERCSSPKEYTDLSDGSHVFSVKATAAAGDTDASPAGRTWTVDTTSPETTIDKGPADGATLSSGDVSFSFSSDEASSTFECRLDGAAFASCTSPQDYTGHSESLHTFEVRATDGAGNVDPTPAVLHYSVELPAPDTDDDTLPDLLDNCPNAANADQDDLDGDGQGDACDNQDNRDSDGDGVQNFEDACPDEGGPASNGGCPASAPTFDVTDYGATSGDGSNDTSAFEKALQDAAQEGADTYVPSGAFRLANVRIPTDTNLAIESTATIKKYGTNNGPVFTMQGVANTSFVQNIHVYGVNGKFTLDLRDAPQDTTGFRLRSVKNFSIKNMDEIGRDNDPSGAVDPNGSILKPVISFLPMDRTPLNGEYEHPHNGVIENITATHQAYGWGLSQLTGAEDVHFQDIRSTGGVALRLENFENNSTTIDDVTADDVTCISGHNAVNMNPHNAVNGDVHITDVTADSCWQGINLADDPAFPNAGFDAASTIDRATVIAGNTAQVPVSRDGWTAAPSEWCVDSDPDLVYSVHITNLSCGRLPSRNWP